MSGFSTLYLPYMDDLVDISNGKLTQVSDMTLNALMLLLMYKN